MKSIRRFLGLLTVFLLILSGCSKNSQTPCSVSGKVTYKGQPVTGGGIAFHRTQEELQGGYGFTINPDGTYTGSSMPAEEYIVTIETESINKDRPPPTYQPRGPAGMGKVGGVKMDADSYRKKMQEMGKMPSVNEEQGKYVKIPAKYGDRKTSPLKAKLDNGSNKKDFDLTD